jgi:hypothetical protein
MSLLPAYFGARKRDDDLAPPTDEADDQSQRDIFNLIPSRAANRSEPVETPAVEIEDDAKPARKPIGKNKHPVDMTDLSRLSIDTDGQLYWDGKPVKSRREVSLSRGQLIAATVVVLMVVIGALGAAVQGLAAAHDWGCKLGWTHSNCALPSRPSQPPPRVDIPA